MTELVLRGEAQDTEELLIDHIQTGRQLLQYFLGTFENGRVVMLAEYLEMTRDFLRQTLEYAP